jgi:uncharacterized protein
VSAISCPAVLRVPVTAARRLALRAQRLDCRLPRGRPGVDAVREVCRALRCLQLDPTNVVARSHLLVLYSRLGAFDPALLERLAYEDRELFEYWAHEASLVLTEDLPLHEWEMGRHPRHPRAVEWWERNAAFRAHILERLRADGPLRARDIEDRSAEPWASTGWTHERNVARMLDFMWVRGQVGIAARAGGQRLWDLMERCLPPAPPRERLDEAELTRRAALLSIGALGMARMPHIRAHFTRGRYPGLPGVLAALRAEGRIEPVAVDGLGDDWWVRAEDVETLQGLANGAWRGRTALLSPFDNLLCDRGRAERLFGFTHRLEIYVPRAKRQWGYFVLPILHGDRLVGRADLAIDRRAGRLVAHAVHREPDAPRGAGIGRAVRRELERLAAWQGAADLELRAVPAEWRLA